MAQHKQHNTLISPHRIIDEPMISNQRYPISVHVLLGYTVEVRRLLTSHTAIHSCGARYGSDLAQVAAVEQRARDRSQVKEEEFNNSRYIGGGRRESG